MKRRGFLGLFAGFPLFRSQNGVSKEIKVLEEAMELQFERVKEQRDLEKQLNFPLPNLHKEIDSCRELAAELKNLKKCQPKP